MLWATRHCRQTYPLPVLPHLGKWNQVRGMPCPRACQVWAQVLVRIATVENCVVALWASCCPQ